MALIDVQGLSKHFGDTQVLRGVSFSVNRGEVVAVIGPSGSGKSTMLRCLIGLERADGGTVRIAGDALVENGVCPPERQMRKVCAKMGMVFQSFNLFPHMTVLQNLTAAPIRAAGRAREAVVSQARALLRDVGLADKADVFPSTLSGGQNSGWPLRGRSCSSRSCCSSTSPRPRSTRSSPRRCSP